MLVLLFHAGFTWMSAGYLGVSVFFTLSGFLITRLLLDENAASGRISLSRFYVRRAKRLLPASLLCIALIAVVRHLGEFSKVETLRRDATSALAQIFNWSRLTGDTSYADMLGDAARSPFEHYWSLAIEEQFYLLWPITVVAILAVCRRRRTKPLPPIATLAVLFAVVAPVIARVSGAEAAYWATPARLAEILVGATLAAWASGRERIPTTVGRLTLPALAAIVVLSVVMPSSSGFAYEGMLPLFALLSGALILGLQAPSRSRRALSWAPIVLLGRISYGVYLFHWPVFVVMGDHGWDVSSVPGFAIALAVTLAIATVSFVFVEQPIRRARWHGPRVATLGAMSLVATLLVVGLTPGPVPFISVETALLAKASIQPADSLVPLVPATPPTTTPSPTTPSTLIEEPAPGRDRAKAPATSVPPTVAPTTTTTFTTELDLPEQPPPRPVRILVVGDSTALFLGQGLAAWQVGNPSYAQVDMLWSPGECFILDGVITTMEAQEYLDKSREVIRTLLPEALSESKPDVVVLMSSVNDIANREWSESEGPLSPFEPVFQQRMHDAYVDLTNRILAAGTSRVVWVIPPIPRKMWLQADLGDLDRYRVQHEVIRDVVGAGLPSVGLVDLDHWFDVTGATDDLNFRPDGLHMTVDSATWLADNYMGPELVRQVLGLPH